MKKIKFLDSSNSIYVNKKDRRGRLLLKKKGVTQPKITTFWKKTVDSFHPTLVLDVGVNYGEILFSSDYQNNVRIIGIEANQNLEKYISNSLRIHPNKNQMQILYALASDCNKENTSFFVSNDFSGVSTAVPNPSFNHSKVRSIKIDSLFPNIKLSNNKLLFKIDVEGFEEKVLKGMTKLITKCKDVIGCIEFNNKYLESAGTNINQYLSFLSKHFKVYEIRGEHKLVRFNILNYDTISHYYKSDTIHTDFLLTKNEDILKSLNYSIKEFHC
ncbi:FkbM family methyltransferase [Paenibacillus sedimenti]|uniref:FkbM family methyltransferase n=1 Tax=Paenibacillus sedimenti TaxID=2770274 RepID=A0A926QKL7_9BACL|nr:FkbM family methyltransferase [Paenibacillus sedimenti]MBD0381564.1 FkbM family methyltransferase [Paenibacillus sedimenti]